MVIRNVVDGQAGLPCPNPTKSYWHSEPFEKLIGFRSTPNLPEVADIAIVGSGITGAFAAHFLKNGKAAGSKVVMLEAREVCWGATGRNGGHCQPLVYASEPDVAEFELKTFAFLRDFVKEHSIPCDWQSFSGVHALMTADLYDLASALVDNLTKKHPTLANKLELVGPASEEPTSQYLSEASGSKSKETLVHLRIPTAAGAILQTNAASLWPYKLICTILSTILSQFPHPSFNLQTNTPVTAIKPTVHPNPYPWTLRTPRGPLRAKQILLATNGYTSRLLPSFTDLLVPVRGQVAALVPPATPPVQLAHSYVFLGTNATAAERNEYLVQRPGPGAELVYGGGRHLARGLGVGVWEDDEVEGEVAAYLRGELGAAMRLGEDWGVGGEDGELEARYEWTGVMGFSRDGNPWVGEVPASAGGGNGGLFLCGGYTGHGMPAAPLCARGVVDMMTDKGKGGELPRSYLLSRSRIEKARKEMGDVKETDDQGLVAQMEQLYSNLTKE